MNWYMYGSEKMALVLFVSVISNELNFEELFLCVS